MGALRYISAFVAGALAFGACSLDVLTPRQITIEPPAVKAPENGFSSDLRVVVVDFEDARQLPEDKVGHYYYFIGDNPCSLQGFSKIVTQAFREGLSSLGINIIESERNPDLLLGGEIVGFYVLYAERPGGSGDIVKQYLNLCQYLEIQLRLVDLKDGRILWEDRIVGEISTKDLWKSSKFSWTAGGCMAKITRLSIERAVTSFITGEQLHHTVDSLKARTRDPEPRVASTPDRSELPKNLSMKKSNRDHERDFALFYDDLRMPIVVDPEEPHQVSFGFAMSLRDVEEILTHLVFQCERQRRDVEAESYGRWAQQVRKMIKEGR
jgi:hypothetical protein